MPAKLYPALVRLCINACMPVCIHNVLNMFPYAYRITCINTLMLMRHSVYWHQSTFPLCVLMHQLYAYIALPEQMSTKRQCYACIPCIPSIVRIGFCTCMVLCINAFMHTSDYTYTPLCAALSVCIARQLQSPTCVLYGYIILCTCTSVLSCMPVRNRDCTQIFRL